MDDICWFVEELAVLVSGQLADRSLAPAADAIAAGRVPKQLANAWSGKYRYGVSGSIVEFVMKTYRTTMLNEMMKKTVPEDLLGLMRITEQELLAQWHAYVTKLNLA